MKTIVLCAMLMAGSSQLHTQSNETTNSIQRNIPRSIFDQQENSMGNIQTVLTNFGQHGLDRLTNSAAAYWPRGSQNQYIFGAGFWFAAKKSAGTEGDTTVSNCAISFNPNSGASWFVPDIHQSAVSLRDSIRNARLMFSGDFDAAGLVKSVNDSIGWNSWSEWKKASDDAFGHYVFNPLDRQGYQGIPLYLSSEDAVATIRDTDLQYYEAAADVLKQRGYPLGLRVHQRSFFFNNDSLKDVMIIRYEIEHNDSTKLLDCWFANAMDFDIGNGKGSAAIASDDRLRYYAEDSTLNMSICWSDNTAASQKSKGLGYMGVMFLQTPAKGMDGFADGSIPMDKEPGLVTHRDWSILNDPYNDAARYDFVSGGVKDSESPAGDKRMLIATGTFNLHPYQRVIVSMAYVFAKPSLGGEANGSAADCSTLVSVARKAKNYYNFLRRSVSSAVEESDEYQSHIQIYPNPATSTVFVRSESAGSTELRIYALTGIERVRMNFSGASSTIDVSSLESGVYICELRSFNRVVSRLVTVHH